MLPSSILWFLSCFSLAAPGGNVPDPGPPNPAWAESAQLISINGSPFDTSQLAGKVVLIINVASKCGYTPQYEGLEKLWQGYRERGLVLLGAPCNQFGGQEPGQAEEIESFCKINYGVTFPLLDKQDVKGKAASPLYRWLESSAAGAGSPVKWNFEKFLVSRDGRVVGRWRSATTPDDADLVGAIERELAAK
jgi:glutathione peroxidase-family protein